jgi:uncharacterized protein YaaN involved in tellurite resistance
MENQQNRTKAEVLVVDSEQEAQAIVEQMQPDKLALRQKPEVQNIARSLTMKDANAIVQFGKEPAVKVSTYADRILNSLKRDELNDTGESFKELSRIMNSIDMKEIQGEPTGFLKKMFYNAEKFAQKLLDKYETLGKDMLKVHNKLVQFEKNLTDSNRMLDGLFQENRQFYYDLENYIIAAEMRLEEFEMRYEQAQTRGVDPLELREMQTVIDVLSQRIYDLDLSRTVALQSALEIKIQEESNRKLILKINSAFTTTIPLFKMEIIKAVSAKRQANVNQAMDALDKHTNELAKRAARNTVEQAKRSAITGGRGALEIETVEEMTQTIINGMKEVAQIEEENRRKLKDGRQRLEIQRQNLKNASSNQ